MPDPAVVVQLREFKAQLLARESSQMADMTRRWLDVEHTLDAKIADLAQEVFDLGLTVPREKVYQLARYRELLAQAKVQVGQYQRWSGQLIADKQAEWAGLGLQQAQAAIQTSFLDAGQIGANFTHLPVEATENMIGFAGNGAPLHDLLKDCFPEAWSGLETALIRATAVGINPRETAAAMRDGFGLGLNKAMVIARTEQIRAYRMASTQQYRESGVVSGFRRLSAHDSRVCLACLAAEGQLFDVAEELTDHVCGRCTAVPIVDGVPEVQFQTGAEWFTTLDPSAQKEMLGADRFQAWQAGAFQFGDLVTHTQNATWGGGIAVTPLNKLMGGGAGVKVTPVAKAEPFVRRGRNISTIRSHVKRL